MNIKSYISAIIYTLLVVLISGCGAELNLPDYQKAPLKDSPNMPTKSQVNTKPKVIIVALNTNGISIATKAKIGISIATKVNTILSQAKSVNIVKRVNDTKDSTYSHILSQEIEASELSKELKTDVGQVDYILSGQISNATYEHSFSEGFYYNCKDSKGNKQQCYSSPRMRYESCVEGHLKVFQLPELNALESFPFNECSSISTEVRSSRDVVYRNDGLVREAAAECADTISYKLKNFFAAKGYIYEKRVKDDDIILKTSLGTQAGAKKGKDVDIYTVIDDNNGLTGEKYKEEIKIGTGTISNQITTRYSWIIVDDMINNQEPKKGDFIKIKSKESIFDKALKIMR